MTAMNDTTENPTPDIPSLVENVLKPCPFCGCSATTRMRSIVICSNCPAEMDGDSIDGSRTAWNTRAESTEVTRLRAELAEEKRKVEQLEEDWKDRLKKQLTEKIKAQSRITLAIPKIQGVKGDLECIRPEWLAQQTALLQNVITGSINNLSDALAALTERKQPAPSTEEKPT